MQNDIQRYIELNNQKLTLEKEIDKLKTKIKKHMVDNKLITMQCNGYTIELGQQDRSTLNSDKVVELLKIMGISDCFTYKEVLDDNKLLEKILRNEVDGKQFTKALNNKKITTLSYK